MLKILYVHGYLGKANGNSSQLLKKAFEANDVDVEIFAPAIPLENIHSVKSYIENISKNYDFIVASSMGAMLSMQIAGKPKILINPAMPKDIKNIPNSFSDDDFIYMEKLVDNFFNNYLDLEFKEETYFIFGSNDDVAHNYDFIAKNYYADNIYLINGMSHSVDINGANKVVDIVKNFNNDNFNPFPYIEEV